jgi:hypothetical protein
MIVILELKINQCFVGSMSLFVAVFLLELVLFLIHFDQKHYLVIRIVIDTHIECKN